MRLCCLYGQAERGTGHGSRRPGSRSGDRRLSTHWRFSPSTSGAFRGWLRIILANHLKHYFRSKQAHAKVRFALDDMTDHRTQLSQLFDLEHDQFLASRAMKMAAGDFSPTTWAAFELQVVQNLPAEVVADRLGLSVNAVLKSKSRVLKRIRQELTRLAC